MLAVWRVGVGVLVEVGVGVGVDCVGVGVGLGDDAVGSGDGENSPELLSQTPRSTNSRSSTSATSGHVRALRLRRL
jgi:hypothetical protein